MGIDIFLIGAATCAIIFFTIQWFEALILKDDEFDTVEEWEQFQQAMKGKK
jgi:hypothetical protein